MGQGLGPWALGPFFVDPCHRMLASGAFAGVTLVNCSLLLSSVVCSMLVYYPRRRSRALAHACTTYVHACPRLRMHAHMCMHARTCACMHMCACGRARNWVLKFLRFFPSKTEKEQKTELGESGIGFLGFWAFPVWKNPKPKNPFRICNIGFLSF